LLAARMPWAGADPGSHVQRLELDHVPYASAAGSEGDRAISLVEIGPVGDEEYPVDPGQRSRERATGTVEVSPMDVDTVTEQRSGSLRAAHENGRPCSGIDEAPSDP